MDGKTFQKFQSVSPAKAYKKPKTEIVPLTKEAREYLESVRKLEPDTIEAFRLGCSTRGSIILPFYDESDNICLIKFRHEQGKMLTGKRKNADGTLDEYEAKSLTEPSGKPVLFGSHLADPDAGALVICFGDYDAMSVSQDGVPNCVSLPYGDKGFQFLDLQWDFLEKFEEVILFPDNDKYPNKKAELKAKEKLEELATRLGKHRVKLAKFSGAKDANELFIKKGKGACLKAVKDADWFPTGIVAVADYVAPEEIEGTPTGLSELDAVTGGFAPGQLVVISGDNGAGKTSEVLNICANYVFERLPVFLWSGEQKVGKIRYWFERIVAGQRNLKLVRGEKTGFEYFFPADDVLEKLRWWYRDCLFQYTELNLTPEKFFEMAAIGIRRFGCKLIVIDNLMAFTGGEGEGYYQSQGDFAQNCKMFAEEWNVTVVLICHNKKEKEGTLPNKDSIEGSKKIQNWADVIIQMYRVPDGRKEEFGNADGILFLCKSREGGILEGFRLLHDRESNRFWQLSEGEQGKYKIMGWEDLIQI
jgi:KaiC/GvpD/RAD55 family RecA-like ATPase